MSDFDISLVLIVVGAALNGLAWLIYPDYFLDISNPFAPEALKGFRGSLATLLGGVGAFIALGGLVGAISIGPS